MRRSSSAESAFLNRAAFPLTRASHSLHVLCTMTMPPTELTYEYAVPRERARDADFDFCFAASCEASCTSTAYFSRAPECRETFSPRGNEEAVAAARSLPAMPT